MLLLFPYLQLKEKKIVWKVLNNYLDKVYLSKVVIQKNKSFMINSFLSEMKSFFNSIRIRILKKLDRKNVWFLFDKIVRHWFHFHEKLLKSVEFNYEKWMNEILLDKFIFQYKIYFNKFNIKINQWTQEEYCQLLID
jgi:hypothetical protein